MANQIEQVLNERGKRYGDFTDHACIAQDLQTTMHKANWYKLDAVQRQALTVIADKIARILSGDPNYDDNWIDIQGYAKLAQDRLPKQRELFDVNAYNPYDTNLFVELDGKVSRKERTQARTAATLQSDAAGGFMQPPNCE